jgi:hypothetical protein
LKPLLLTLGAAAALALAACGGDDGSATATEPLSMEQRVVTEDDAPDSKADPVEKPESVSSPDEFISRFGDRFINPPAEDVEELRSGSFVQARHETRFIAEEHSQTAPHIFSLVIQFETEDDASRAVEILHEDSIRPCPETCANQAEEFDVSDIPGAEGTHRFATAESIEATGDTEIRPFDEYEIDFADGVFAYRIQVRGSPGEVSQDEAEEIVANFYDRVHGAPAG